jgi:hypothetical protein
MIIVVVVQGQTHGALRSSSSECTAKRHYNKPGSTRRAKKTSSWY